MYLLLFKKFCNRIAEIKVEMFVAYVKIWKKKSRSAIINYYSLIKRSFKTMLPDFPERKWIATCKVLEVQPL